MRELGFPDDAAAAFKENAITGGDVLQLGDEELSGDLGLSRLQVNEKNFSFCFSTSSTYRRGRRAATVDTLPAGGAKRRTQLLVHGTHITRC